MFTNTSASVMSISSCYFVDRLSCFNKNAVHEVTRTLTSGPSFHPNVASHECPPTKHRKCSREGVTMSYERKFFIFLATIVVMIASLTTAAFASRHDADAKKKIKVEAPLNIAILIQDDLVSHVGNEIGVTADFIRSLPSGSRVLVGYITAGTLQVRAPFT